MASTTNGTRKSAAITAQSCGAGSNGVNVLAQTLAREFDAPIGLIDPEGPVWRVRMGLRADAFPPIEEALAAVKASGLLGHGRVMVWRPAGETGPVWLGVPAVLPGDSLLVALVGFAAAGSEHADAEFWGPSCPDRALRAWGQAMADRLRAEAARTEPSLAAARPKVDHLEMIQRLIRKLKVSDPPERFQRLASSVVREALGVEAVAWVPSQPREPAIVAGEVPGVGVEAYRALLPETREVTVQVVNQPTGTRPAGIHRLAVVTADNDATSGWFVVVNPLDDRAFTAAEIAELKPIATLISAHRSNAHVYADLKDLLFGVIRALTSAIDAKDPYTSGHSERVARIAVRLAEELDMPTNQRGDLYLMGLLHDVGKIGVEDGVLKKTGPLTPEEFRIIQSHVRIGVHILSDLKKLHHLLPGVAHHHESLDGSGYPSGLVGEAIPLEARILAVADAFDAMSSTRPYRRRLTPLQIDEIFREGSGRQWDPNVVRALFASRGDLEMIRQKGIGDSLNQVVAETLGRS